MAAPSSTFDLTIKNGSFIPIEERGPEEVTTVKGKRIAPYKVKVKNPAFDVTPKNLIAGIITEKGVIRPPFKDIKNSCQERAADVAKLHTSDYSSGDSCHSILAGRTVRKKTSLEDNKNH